MCLILFAWKAHPSYPLILAANRDEFYDRPSQPADFWKDHPRVLAGIDLQEKGTWLGVAKDGRFAAVTNYRDPSSWRPDAPSRGQLVSRFLTGSEDPGDYLQKMSGKAHRYNGFNLLAGDVRDLFVYSNRDRILKLDPGIYGLSNHLLDSPWPKVKRGKKLLAAALERTGQALEDALFDLLANRRVAPDAALPQTGVTLEWERMLSPMFIKTPVYGTRASTVLLIARNGRIRFVEKTFNGADEPWLVSRFSFQREAAA
jgi:uncharacterized protein with NRDE domain